MTIRFGVSPIAWINDDMPELGGDTSVEDRGMRLKCREPCRPLPTGPIGKAS